MPRQGPGGVLFYTPDEAYDSIGRHYFRSTWSPVFAPGEMLPHPPAAQTAAREHRLRPTDIERIGDPASAAYRQRQQKAYRTNKILKELRDALHWGKADSFRREGAERWQPITFGDWKADQPWDALVEEIRRVHILNHPPRTEFLINKAQLDDWIGHQAVPNIPIEGLDAERRPPGRPREYDRNVVVVELWRRVELGEFPDLESGWRTRFCEELREWCVQNFGQVNAPKVRTLIKHLKLELDQVEQEIRREQLRR